MSDILKTSPLPPYPSSWYLICPADELKAGQLKELQFCGHEAVAYRTASGKPLLVGAYCPHMGAHLGRGGQVKGEDLQCPFHGFCFDPSGQCVKTGYGTRAPKQARLRTWQVREVNGLLMAWHDELGLEPTWEIPPLEWGDWSPLRFRSWTINSHPQEIAENSVDIGHFRYVHGYDEVQVFQEAAPHGPVLKGRYGMSRVANFIGKGGKKVKAEFDFYEIGLGYALVEAEVPEYGLKSRHFVFPTPLDGKEINLTIAVSVHRQFSPQKIHPLLGLLPKGFLFKFIVDGYQREYTKDVSDDFHIWTNKTYVHPPALAQGDGPVIVYRKWAQQFYPAAAQ
jgi:phenylpropionate dioxygenase-like ring-hydroxylating dioxygenase large terminal subunit